MKLIAGLGNPGTKYEKTRHNVGFLAMDFLAENQEWKKSRRANCLYIRKDISGQETELIKPLAHMNNSGKAVNYIAKKHRIKPEDIIVIHDDIDLLLGEIKVQEGRGSAGHKGVQSIIDQLGTKNFTRIRIGIRPVESGEIIETEKFVLEKFTSEEKEIIERAIKKAVQTIGTTL